MLFFDELKTDDHRLRWVAMSVLAGMFALLAGLWYIQVVSASQYLDRQKNQSIRTVRMPAIRGKILDRNGLAIAESRPSFNVNLYLEDIRPLFTKEFYRLKAQRVANRLVKRLSRLEDSELQNLARYNVVSNLTFQVSRTLGHPLVLNRPKFEEHYLSRRYAPLPILSDLTPDQVALFVESGSKFPGTELDVQPLRVYPRGTLAAHLLGHLQRTEDPDPDGDLHFNYPVPDFVGVMGLERVYDGALRGKGGCKSILVNHEGYRESEEIWPEPSPGKNLVTTLDVNIQQACERALRPAGMEYNGAAVVMDTGNGDILGMASSPAFDPNLFVPTISQTDWDQLNDLDRRPMLNRASYGTYPPGSAFKIIVSLAALEAGVLDPNEIFHSQGFYQLTPRSKRIADTAGPGDFDFKRAFMRSSNPYFIDYGLKTGPEKLVAMGRRFHLGQRTGIALRAEEENGYLPKPKPLQRHDGEKWYPGDTANLSIGQGDITVTPLQMAVLTAAVANGGKILRPRLVLRTEPQDNFSHEETERVAPEIIDQIQLNPDHLALLHRAMLADVEEEGTGKGARVDGWHIGGKTGTAQKTRVENGQTHIDHITWFVSFAPAESPRYAVVVMVSMLGKTGSGGGTCAPIARKIYEALLVRERQQEQQRKTVAGAER